MFTKGFVLGAVERAVKSVAQVLLSMYAVGEGFDLLAVDLKAALAVAGGAALFSLLTSVVSAPHFPHGSPSLVDDRQA